METAVLDRNYTKGPYEVSPYKEGMLLPLVSDTVFNCMINNSNRLKYAAFIISEVLNEDFNEIYNSLEYDKNLLNQYNFYEKGKRVDFICMINDRYVNIELNNYGNSPLKKLERNLSYVGRIYDSKTKRGDKSDEFNPCIQININNFTIEGEEDILDEYCFMGKKGGSTLTKKIVIYQIYLPNIRKKMYNNGELNNLEKFMLVANEQDIEILGKLSKGVDILEDFLKDRIAVSDVDGNVIGAYDGEAFDKWMAEQNKKEATLKGIKQGIEQGIEQGFEQGIEQGIEQGSKNRNIEIAKKLLLKNMSVKEISSITDLSINEIEELK